VRLGDGCGRLAAALQPHADEIFGHGTECVAGVQAGLDLLFAALDGRIAAIPNQIARLVTQGAGLFQADVRPLAQRQALLDAVKAVFEVPDLRAGGSDLKIEAFFVGLRGSLKPKTRLFAEL
jgi:hypothetical protein